MKTFLPFLPCATSCLPISAFKAHGGAHDSVHRFVKAWRVERARVPVQAFVPVSFAPSGAYQFDWSHETITLQGLPLVIKAAHMTGPSSNCC